MANFPTSAITFTPFANGATSDAAQVTAIYAEVEAIEAGYLQGTARLNSSNSTVAALSVSGASTFVGIATFSTKIEAGSTKATIGDSSVAFKEIHCSSLILNGVGVSIAAEYVKVTGSSQAISSGGSTVAITWLTQDGVANSSLHSTGTNPERFTPQSTGGFMFTASLALSSVNGTASTRNYVAQILDSSGGVVGHTVVGVPEAGGGGGIGITLNVSGFKHFDAVGSTHWLRVTVQNNSASTTSLNPALSFAHFVKV